MEVPVSRPLVPTSAKGDCARESQKQSGALFEFVEGGEEDDGHESVGHGGA
jgi:hypothetical protein